MDPRKLFADQRLRGYCVYCGRNPDTRDHVPSLVLLDEPYPPNLRIVECCWECNNSLSADEQYLACFIDCVIYGTSQCNAVHRSKVARILSETPALAARIAASEVKGSDGQRFWKPDQDRINRVVLKLARGHLAYELSSPRLDAPSSIRCVPFQIFDEPAATKFLGAQPTTFWPEIGSRAFIQACYEIPKPFEDVWQVVQEARYQFLVSQAEGELVRILISNYLACEVRWD